MTDQRIEQLLQEAENHLKKQSCRARYERSVIRLPDSRRNIWLKDDERVALKPLLQKPILGQTIAIHPGLLPSMAPLQ